MKNLQTTTTGNLFNHTGILTHAGDYAGRFQDESINILEKISDREDEIFTSDGSSYGWADIMINENSGKIYAVWGNDMLTAQNGLVEYTEMEREDNPDVYDIAQHLIEYLKREDVEDKEDPNYDNIPSDIEGLNEAIKKAQSK